MLSRELWMCASVVGWLATEGQNCWATVFLLVGRGRQFVRHTLEDSRERTHTCPRTHARTLKCKKCIHTYRTLQTENTGAVQQLLLRKTVHHFNEHYPVLLITCATTHTQRHIHTQPQTGLFWSSPPAEVWLSESKIIRQGIKSGSSGQPRREIRLFLMSNCARDKVQSYIWIFSRWSLDRSLTATPASVQILTSRCFSAGDQKVNTDGVNIRAVSSFNIFN